MHIELDQLIAYRDGSLSPSEQKMIEQKLSECEECRARYAALEHLSAGLKDLFSSYKPKKSPDCPDKSFWLKYLNGQLDTKDETRWKEHLRKCDYCFNIVSTQLVNEAAESEFLHLPKWLQQKALETTNVGSSLQERWKNFVARILRSNK